MPLTPHCRTVAFGLLAAMLLARHLAGQEEKQVYRPLPPKAGPGEALHDIPLCGDSTKYVHQIPPKYDIRYLPISIQLSGTSAFHLTPRVQPGLVFKSSLEARQAARPN